MEDKRNSNNCKQSPNLLGTRKTYLFTPIQTTRLWKPVDKGCEIGAKLESVAYLAHEGLASCAPPTSACWVFQHGFTARAEVLYESERPMTDSDASIPDQRLWAGCAFQKGTSPHETARRFTNPGLTSSWNQTLPATQGSRPDYLNQAYLLENASSSSVSWITKLPPHFVQTIRTSKLSKLSGWHIFKKSVKCWHSESLTIQSKITCTSTCLHYIWANNAHKQEAQVTTLWGSSLRMNEGCAFVVTTLVDSFFAVNSEEH